MSGLSIHSLVRRVDLLTLKLFLTAIEEGQIGRAAAREHIAPSAATKRIQSLEELAGLRLFDRNAKGVALSEAGEVFARHIRAMLGILDDMRREVSAFNEGIRGHVGIAAPGMLIVQFLASEIGEFTTRFPQVNVDLREDSNGNVLRALMNGDVDLAVFVANTDPVDDSIESYECCTDRLVAILPPGHRLRDRCSMTLDELLDEDLIGLAPWSNVTASLRDAAKEIGRELQPRYSVNTVMVARSMVAAGLGLTVHPQSMLPQDGNEHLAVVRLSGDWTHRSYHVGRLRGKAPTAPMDAFIEQLADLSHAVPEIVS
jgi:DNA-binding transcriptional LysR family regulator